MSAPRVLRCRLALGVARGRHAERVHDKAAAVLHHEVAKVAEPGARSGGLLIESAVGVGRAFMRVVGARFATKIDFAVAPRTRRWGFVLGPETLHRGPRLDQGAIDREVLIGGEPRRAGARQPLGKELVDDRGLQQPLARIV